ncbi:MAG TPA: hypothetical protein PKA90_01625 [Ignavibacteria bacterium]|nr:hypothetical protein [Ignavibacteria bacterium]
MKPSRELFDLIKSMSGSEKRYFKLNVSLQKGSKNYLKLFSAIERQNVFDEIELRKLIKDEKIVKNITITKNYLYKLIIKSLTQFRNDRSIDLKLNFILSRCKLMYEKGLFPEYFKTIKSGKEAALKHEKYTILLDFLELEKNLIKKDEIGKKDMNQIYDYESEVLDRIKEISYYKKIVTGLFIELRITGIIRDEISDHRIKKLCRGLSFRESKIQLPVRAHNIFLLAKYLECRLTGDLRKSMEFCKQRYSLILKNPDVFKDYLQDPKLDALEFHITSALRLNDFKEAKKVLSRIKKISKDSAELDLTFTEIEFRLCECTENEDKANGKKVITQLEDYLEKYEGKILINSENYFRFSIIKHYFMTENYTEALNSVNDFLNRRQTKLTPEFESYSRILNILIHFELGNYKLLAHLIPTTKKYLMNKKKYFRFESEIIRCIKKIISLKNKDSVNKNFNDLFKKLLILKKDKYNKNAFVYFDPERWVEKKIFKI